MTYNILNYIGTGADNGRENALRLVVGAVNPDILIAEEVRNTDGYNHFLTDVLNYNSPDLYTGADFTNQSSADMDIALFYKPDLFSFVSTKAINTTNEWGNRDVVEFVMTHIQSETQFRVYGVHLKAGSGSSNQNERKNEATKLRNYLNTLDPGTPFMVLGDFNIYNSTEDAFQLLTESQNDNDGRLFDPINRIGNWHNSTSFADVHTQSTRSGNYGGLDDRFDWIMISEAVMNDSSALTYVGNTYKAYGNDGQHLNLAINDSPVNSAVGQAMANALEEASDHLPVVADFKFRNVSPSPFKVVISEIMPNPSKVSDSYGEWVEIVNIDTIAIDLTGWVLKDNDNEYHVIDPDGGSLILSPWDVMVFARNADSTLNGGFTARYQYSGYLLSNTEDEVILLDTEQKVVDKVFYTAGFPFRSGASMYLKDMSYDNNMDTSWSQAVLSYGAGDLGTPGRIENDSLYVISPELNIPEDFILFQNYPNPFNALTRISFHLHSSTYTHLAIYNVLGREISVLINEVLPSGLHQIQWDARKAVSGIYFYRLTSEGNTKVKKLILIK